jgi:hypothetical protein
MFGFKKGKKKSLDVFNISFSISGYHGPFRDFYDFFSRAEIASKVKPYVGNFHVNNNGEVKPGFINGLHTLNADFDLDEFRSSSGILGGISMHHIPYNSEQYSGILDVLVSSEKMLFLDVRGNPIYTLDGLYSTLPNNKINTRINAINQCLEYFDNPLDNSIATRKETKLKIAENLYRRKVSNQ